MRKNRSDDNELASIDNNQLSLAGDDGAGLELGSATSAEVADELVRPGTDAVESEVESSAEKPRLVLVASAQKASASEKIVVDPAPSVVPEDGFAARYPTVAKHQNYVATTNRAKLVRLLNDHLSRNTMPMSIRRIGTIARKELADALGITPASLVGMNDIVNDYDALLKPDTSRKAKTAPRPVVKNIASKEPMDDEAAFVVAKYPELLMHQHYGLLRTSGQIVRILNRQINADELVRGKGGGINRAVIARELGCNHANMQMHKHIFDDYEQALGDKQSKVIRQLPEIREWLSARMADGTLQTRDRKLSRAQLFQAFGWANTGARLVRNPELAKLVDEFDALIVEKGYMPRDVVALLDAVKGALENDPVIDKDGMTISRPAIAQAIGIAPHILNQSPYAETIASAEATLMKQRESDPLIALIGGRIFEFQKLIEAGWPQRFSIRVKECFERVYRSSTKDEAKGPYALIIDFLTFVAASKSDACNSVLNGVVEGHQTKSLVSVFTVATQEWRDRIGADYENAGTRRTKISTTNVVLRHLSADGVLPPFELPLIGFLNDKKTHLKSVAEATPTDEFKASETRNPDVDDYVVFAMSMLKQAADAQGIDVSGKDQSEFTKLLREELDTQQFTAADNPATLIRRVLERRLGLIKDAAIKVMLAARQHWEAGRALLERAEDLTNIFETIAGNGSRDINAHQRRQLLRQYLPLDDGTQEQGIANLLKVVVDRFGGIYPMQPHESYGQFFQKRALDYGGALKLQAYLIPPQQAVAAVLTLYLLESGSNVSVGRSLNRDCIEVAEEPHHSKIIRHPSTKVGTTPVLENSTSSFTPLLLVRCIAS